MLTTGTLEGREQRLNALLVDVTGLADTTREFLDENEENLVRAPEVNLPALRLLARYAPGLPCLLGGIERAGVLNAETFRNFTLHINLQLLPRQPRAYDENDVPVFGDDRGPGCGNLPNPPWSQENPVDSQPDFVDGVDRPTGKGTMRVAPGSLVDTERGYLTEDETYREVLAPVLGVDRERVDPLGSLLLAPMARGAEVSVR